MQYQIHVASGLTYNDEIASGLTGYVREPQGLQAMSDSLRAYRLCQRASKLTRNVQIASGLTDNKGL